MMKCSICGKPYPMSDPIRRTCGNHSERLSQKHLLSGDKFFSTISKNFQNPFYQNHSHSIFRDDEHERYYSMIWWGF